MEILKEHRIEILRVWDGLDDFDIASTIPPVMVGEWREDVSRWSNGPTEYERYTLVQCWVVRWGGEYVLITTYRQEGDYADGSLAHWEQRKLPVGDGFVTAEGVRPNPID